MQKLTLLCLVGVLAMGAARPEYTDKYDNIDLDNMLSNKRLLEPIVKCVLDLGPCSPEGKELKAHIKEALENNCGKCTMKQRSGTRKVMKHIINHEVTYWQQLKDKYDPERKFVTKYEKELKELKSESAA